MKFCNAKYNNIIILNTSCDKPENDQRIKQMHNPEHFRARALPGGVAPRETPLGAPERVGRSSRGSRKIQTLTRKYACLIPATGCADDRARPYGGPCGLVTVWTTVRTSAQSSVRTSVPPPAVGLYHGGSCPNSPRRPFGQTCRQPGGRLHGPSQDQGYGKPCGQAYR